MRQDCTIGLFPCAQPKVWYLLWEGLDSHSIKEEISELFWFISGVLGPSQRGIGYFGGILTKLSFDQELKELPIHCFIESLPRCLPFMDIISFPLCCFITNLLMMKLGHREFLKPLKVTGFTSSFSKSKSTSILFYQYLPFGLPLFVNMSCPFFSLSLTAFRPFSLSECECFFHSMFWALGDPFNLEAPAIQFC